MLTQEQLDNINNVMDEFNFNKVARVMKFIEWHWFIGGEMKIPSESEIRKHARELLTRLYGGNLKVISCGGFEAHKKEDNLSLMFILTEYNHYS